jgi:hypothetical protein
VSSLSQIGQAWQQFFHAPEPVATLCVFRMLFGLLLVANGLNLLLYADDFFGPLGILGSRGFAKTYPRPRLSIFHLLPASSRTAYGVVLALIAASAAMTVGLFTSVSTPVAWLCLVSLHHRNPTIFNAGDTLQRLLLLLLCFTPSGLALSFDSWLSGKDPIAAMRDEQFDPWAFRLIQIQLTIVYVRAVYWKLRGKPWRDGTAVALVLHTMGFRRLSAPLIIESPSIAAMLAYGTMAAEAAIPIGLWVRELRYPAIIGGLMLHLSFELFLNVHLFGLTMCVGLMAFVPPQDLIAMITAWRWS